MAQSIAGIVSKMGHTPHWTLRLASIFSSRIRSNLAADQGDLHRAARNWAQAALCYERAVRIRPDRRAIWVQLGHMLKDAGQSDKALEAYRSAAALAGDDGDAPFHYGVLARQLGNAVQAKVALLQAHRENSSISGLRSELLAVLHEPHPADDSLKDAAEQLIIADGTRLASAPTDMKTDVIFDVSDLVGHFRHARLPTGIQRVQMEVVKGALAGRPATQIGCFSERAMTWIAIPAAMFGKICVLAVQNDDPLEREWLDTIELLSAVLANGPSVSFAKGSFLVNLGTSWWIESYFLCLRHIRHEYSVHYVPFVHDLIPVIKPEYFVHAMIQEFIGWAGGVFDHAAFFLTNSQATARDLNHVATVLDHPLPSCAVVPLNASFSRPEASDDELGRWNLAPRGFALFVSTVEARKNHLATFRSWQVMIARHGAEKVPDLVCVGSKGWLNDHIYFAVESDPVLAKKVRMLSDISDGELALLYRTCLFSLYPSSYEGWGLPVTESLCFGKIPLLSRSSSLPEAGGEFARYVDVEDQTSMVAELELLSFDAERRAEWEQYIQAYFRARSWADIAAQIQEEVDSFVKMTELKVTQSPDWALEFHQLYRMRRNRKARLTGKFDNGENLLAGLGWWPLEDWGCFSREAGARLRFALPEGHATARCYIRLCGLKDMDNTATINSRDVSYRVDLPRGQWRWVSIPVMAIAGVVELELRGDCGVEVLDGRYGRSRRVGVGLGGFIAVDDAEIRTLSQVARVRAGRQTDAYTFLRDVFMILMNRDIADGSLQDYLPGLESGEMSWLDTISALETSPEGRMAVCDLIVFD